jgi:hypothetical protein
MWRMNAHLLHLLHSAWITSAAVVLLAAALSIIPRLGMIGWHVSAMLCKAPLLDLIVACFTWIPWLVAAKAAGWAGFAGAIIGQFIALGIWCTGHELVFREAARGPRIVKLHARIVGRWQNHMALWVTLIALPIFWSIRIMQMTLWWTLPLLLKFPSYKQSEWINVSRHKFDGLVGHDLIWCLYCDWMTGVYSMGAEMLRNVESFWCPIRFYEGKKCANCAVDFPDIDNGWVAPDKSMADVVAKMEEMYSGGRREWFGHPARLTVKGQPIEEPAATSAAP